MTDDNEDRYLALSAQLATTQSQLDGLQEVVKALLSVAQIHRTRLDHHFNGLYRLSEATGVSLATPPTPQQVTALGVDAVQQWLGDLVIEGQSN